MNRTIVAETNGHKWIEYEIGSTLVNACINCGVIRKKDDDNKPCVGVVKVGLR